MRLLMKTYCVENLYNMPGSISLVKQIPDQNVRLSLEDPFVAKICTNKDRAQPEILHYPSYKK